MSTRVPPHDLGAEEALLGAMLLSRDAVGVGLELVDAADFYRPAHAHVLDAIRYLNAAGEPVDVATVAGRLGDLKLLDEIGGPVQLISLQNSTPATSSAARYARTVANHALLRRLIGVAGEVAELGYETTSDEAGDALDRAEALLFTLARRRRSPEGVALGEALVGWLEELERVVAGEGTPGLATGWTDLDRMLLGLHPGQLVTIAARPSIGKSAVALALAAQVGAAGRRAVVFSAEMGLKDLLTRIVSRHAQVDSQHLRSGRVSERDLLLVDKTVSSLVDVPVVLVDDPSASLLSIRSAARRQASQPGGVGVVIVDYLQLLVAGQRENRQVEVAELARGLKRLAGELAVPIVALAQLNRGLEARHDKRPTLADLRESGEIENASDVVIGLYRDEVYNPESADRGVMEMIVLKQRNGPIGTVRLAYEERYGLLRDLAAD